MFKNYLDEDKNNNLVIIIGNPKQSAIKHSKQGKKIVVDFLKSRENFSQTKDKSENKNDDALLFFVAARLPPYERKRENGWEKRHKKCTLYFVDQKKVTFR